MHTFHISFSSSLHPHFNTKARKKTNPKHPNVSMVQDKNVCWPCVVNIYFFSTYLAAPGTNSDHLRREYLNHQTSVTH